MQKTEPEIVVPRVLELREVAFNSERFFAPSVPDERFSWSDVVQVALVFEVHAVAMECCDYVAFRFAEPNDSVWVLLESNESFVAEVERRFAALSATVPAKWKDEKRCITSYTVWPTDRLGEPLYVNVRLRWWSFEQTLAFKRHSQPSATDNPDDAQ